MQGFGETPHHQLWVSGWRRCRPSPRRPRGSCACVSAGARTTAWQGKNTPPCPKGQKKKSERKLDDVTACLYLLGPPTGVHGDGADELRRDTADRRAHRGVGGGVVVGLLLLALAGDATPGQRRSLLHWCRAGLHTCTNGCLRQCLRLEVLFFFRLFLFSSAFRATTADTAHILERKRLQNLWI